MLIKKKQKRLVALFLPPFELRLPPNDLLPIISLAYSSYPLLQAFPALNYIHQFQQMGFVFHCDPLALGRIHKEAPVVWL